MPDHNPFKPQDYARPLPLTMTDPINIKMAEPILPKLVGFITRPQGRFLDAYK